MTRSVAFRSLWHMPFWTEVWSGMAALLWAGHVMFERRSLMDVRPFHQFGLLASGSVWAALAALAGAVQIVVAFSHVRVLRGVVDVLVTVVWLIMVVLIYRSGAVTPSVAAFEALIGMNLQASVWLLSPLIGGVFKRCG